MNTLSIQRRMVTVEEHGECEVIDVLVDGITIKEIVHASQPGFFDSDVTSNPEGLFTGIFPSTFFDYEDLFCSSSHRHFTGEYSSSVPLMTCSDCGMYWCGGVWTRIMMTPNHVTWSGLGYIDHQSGFSHIPGSCQMIFDRNQYLSVFRDTPP